MSKDVTRRPKWLQAQRDNGAAVRWWAARNTPWFTRAYWPRAKVGLPNFPTMSGKRPASRAVRQRMWVDIRRSNKHRPRTLPLEKLAARWVVLHAPRENNTMRKHVEFMAMSNEERERSDDF